MIKSRLIAAAGILAAFVLAQSVRADSVPIVWTLTTGDFTEQPGLTVNTWGIAEGLSVTGESGKLSKTDTRNVLSLISSHAGAATVGGGAAWRMTLRNGDVVYGEPVAISGQSIEFKMIEMGSVAVPLKLVSAISMMKPGEAGAVATGSGPVTEIVAPADNDVVRLKNGDVLKGLIVNVDSQKLQISVGDTNPVTSDVEMSRVDRFTFGGVSLPRGVPALSARLTFISGSVLTIPLDAKQKSFSWSINDIVFKDQAGVDRKATPDMLASIDVTGGRVVYLTELDPAKEEQSTFMGTQWPTQINKNVVGQPLKVGKTTFARGLGVHTRSDITYELDGSFETLKFRVGMDNSAAPQGMADVSVVLDGKVIWEAKDLKGGGAGVDGKRGEAQISEEVSLPIKGGKRLELRADPALDGGKIDVLGRVDWLNVALVRP